jgi:membrane protease YdiL (CAAX protease family)
MRALIDTTTAARPAAGDEAIPQYSRGMVLAVWAAAAVPMALLAWVVAPTVASDGASQERFFITLLTALMFGLLWQAVLVVILVMRERRDPSWTNIRDRLWLRPPRTASRRGGRLWWWVLVFALALAAVDMAPFGPAGPDGRSFGLFLESDAGQATFHHAWWLYALVAFMLVLNTVVGEELLFRGLLLPRMQGAFGRADWIVNGVLFGVYHLHEPWIIPNAIMTGFLCAGPSRRYRSALMGIAIHSVESVFFLVVLLPVVIG